MGLFSKLFGDANRQIVRGLTDELVKNAQQQSSQPQNVNQNSTYPAQQSAQPTPSGPSGFSWGPVMPAEENQYNYNGSYIDYFMEIFRSEFSQYQITCQPSQNMQYVLINFSMNNNTALVVELLSKKSSVTKMRNRCKAAGIPYLRYYHNVEGWWNTRSYVINRTRNALCS